MSVSKKNQFATGDRVFAKMKGYPAWPARIIAIASEKINNMRYHVTFYGTHQTAIIKAENLYLYSENKEKFGVAKKQKNLAEALKEIETELSSSNSEQDNANFFPTVIKNIDGNDSTVESETVDDSENDGTVSDSSKTPITKSPAKKPRKSVASHTLKHKMDTSESEGEQTVPKKSRKLSATNSKAQANKVENRTTIVDNNVSPRKKSPVKKLGTSSTDEDTFKTPKTVGRKHKQNVSPTDEKSQDSSTDDECATFKVPNASVPRKSKQSSVTKVKTEDEEDRSLIEADGKGPSTSGSETVQKRSRESERDIMTRERELKKKEKDLKKRERREKKKRDRRNFIVAVVNGQCQKIPLYLNRPRFTDRSNADYWDEMVLHYANALKDRLEAGETLADPYEIMNDWTTLKSFEVVKHNIAEGSVQKINFLRIEAHLLDMDVELKQSLSLQRADTDKCFEVLNQMKELSITPLMLKKQPDVVFTIRRMRNYIGNINNWNMTQKEIEEFRKTARKIRVKADEVYTKFKILFNAIKQPNFWIYFSHQVDIFREKTKKMSLNEMLSLVQEPA